MGSLAGHNFMPDAKGDCQAVLLFSMVDRPKAPAECALRCAPEYLPLPSNSVDLVVAPHCLEFSPQPERVLKEMARVILPGGQLAIAGFNPLGLWNMAHQACLWRRHRAPWYGHPISLRHMRRSLGTLHFDIIATRHACYKLPITNTRYKCHTRLLETLGPRCWPSCGAAYLVLAKKRRLPLTPMRIRWSRQSRKLVGTAGYTANSTPWQGTRLNHRMQGFR